MKIAALALVLAVSACTTTGKLTVSTANQPANHVVIQVSDNDPAKWNLALNNARNLQSDLGASNVEIEIVVYGPGLNMLKTGSAVAPRIDESVLGGIKVMACENTMTNTRVTRDQMLPGVGYVPAGVVEIMKREQEGWAYIRP